MLIARCTRVSRSHPATRMRRAARDCWRAGRGSCVTALRRAILAGFPGTQARWRSSARGSRRFSGCSRAMRGWCRCRDARLPVRAQRRHVSWRWHCTSSASRGMYGTELHAALRSPSRRRRCSGHGRRCGSITSHSRSAPHPLRRCTESSWSTTSSPRGGRSSLPQRGFDMRSPTVMSERLHSCGPWASRPGWIGCSPPA